MSGKYDRIKGEQPLPFVEPESDAPGDSILARIRAARPPEAEAAAKAYGRRADPSYTQLNANIPNELKRKLKRFTDDEGVTISEVVERLLEDYLAVK